MASEPTPFTRHIASTLRAEKARRNISAKDIAAAMDLSLSQTYKILNGQKPINMDQLMELCMRMGLDIAVVVAHARQATLPRKPQGGSQSEGDLVGRGALYAPSG